jgi:hypothetical protein
MWSYIATSGYQVATDLGGFAVEATDGRIGKVDKHSDAAGDSYIVVDVGVWIFGRQLLLPAGTVASIDLDNRTVHIDRTKEEIKNSPEFDQEKHLGDTGYREQIRDYYHPERI